MSSPDEPSAGKRVPRHPLATRQVVQPPVLYHSLSATALPGGEIHERKKVGSEKKISGTDKKSTVFRAGKTRIYLLS